MRYVMRTLVVALLFVGLGLLNIGGCGGSSGGGGGGGATCLLPALDTDFSNELYIFIDPFLGLVIGVTSDGETVVIALVDSELNTIGLIADPLGAFACDIFGALVEDVLFNASGLCARSDDAELFAIFDLIVGNIFVFEESIGECFAVEPLNTAVAQRGEGESLADATQRAVEDATVNAFLDMQTRGELDTENPDYIYLEDSLDKLEN